MVPGKGPYGPHISGGAVSPLVSPPRHGGAEEVDGLRAARRRRSSWLDPVPLPELSSYTFSPRYLGHWGVRLRLERGCLGGEVPASGGSPIGIRLPDRAVPVAPGGDVTADPGGPIARPKHGSDEGRSAPAKDLAAHPPARAAAPGWEQDGEPTSPGDVAMVLPVVAGVDGSAESLAAAAGVPPTPFGQWGRAAHEAVRRERPLRLVHAWNGHPRQEAGEREIANAAQRHLARRSLRQAEKRIRAACPGVRLADEQVEGPATAALLKAADQAEPMVLGSRGLSGFTGFLVGSDALGVVAWATWPVVLVRADEKAADEHLPASDRSPATDTGHRDVVLAFEAAGPRHARLRAVHARQAPGPLGLGAGRSAWCRSPSSPTSGWASPRPCSRCGGTSAPTWRFSRASSRTSPRPRSCGPRPERASSSSATASPSGRSARAPGPSPTRRSTTTAAPWPSYRICEGSPNINCTDNRGS